VLSGEGVNQPPVEEQAEIPAATTSQWAELCERLIREFPDVPASAVYLAVGDARAATHLFGQPAPQQLGQAETMARNNLTIMQSGETLARLHPESHRRRTVGDDPLAS